MGSSTPVASIESRRSREKHCRAAMKHPMAPRASTAVTTNRSTLYPLSRWNRVGNVTRSYSEPAEYMASINAASPSAIPNTIRTLRVYAGVRRAGTGVMAQFEQGR